VQALRRVRAAGIGPSSSAQPEGSGAEETWSPVASRDPLYDSEDELVQADASGTPGTGRNIMARRATQQRCAGIARRVLFSESRKRTARAADARAAQVTLDGGDASYRALEWALEVRQPRRTLRCAALRQNICAISSALAC
jgi:hypothetical protein